MPSPRRMCLATFRPQAWVNDNAVDIDDGGFDFDITDVIETMGADKALAIADSSNESDNLYLDWRTVHPDPDHHRGPFSVDCASAIAAYFGKPDPNDWRNM